MDEDRARELEEKYQGYKVNDNEGRKIGKVDDLFIDENDREEYLGVNIGFLSSKSVLIPIELTTVDHESSTIEVSASKDQVKDSPTFNSDDDITPEYETRVREHFGLGPAQQTSQEPDPAQTLQMSPAEGYRSSGKDEPVAETEPDGTAPTGGSGIEEARTEGAEETAVPEEPGKVRVIRRTSTETPAPKGAPESGARVRRRPGEG
ncbi:MAG: PRC-barrel domain-containing protein [Rubrobacter sp.]|nr:PRC-barrel domain-containing protein [Rubrobacter sp.]